MNTGPALLESRLVGLSKVKLHRACDPALALWVHTPWKNLTQNHRMSIIRLMVEAKRWWPSGYPLPREWTGKLWKLQRMKHHAVVRRDEIDPHKATWIGLQNRVGMGLGRGEIYSTRQFMCFYLFIF